MLIARALVAIDDDPSAAVELAQRAVERAAYAPLISAEARLVHGRALARANRRAEAIEALTDARTELGVIGAHRLRDEAAQELRRLGRTVAGRQRRAGSGPGVDALSGREREIADLVALGHSNRQIAAEIFLSEKTVEGHLTNVFASWGCRRERRWRRKSLGMRQRRHPDPQVVARQRECDDRERDHRRAEVHRRAAETCSASLPAMNGAIAPPVKRTKL